MIYCYEVWALLDLGTMGFRAKCWSGWVEWTGYVILLWLIAPQKKNIRILEVGAGTATPVETFFLWILMSLVFASFTVFLHNNALWQMTIECPLGERWGRVENKNLKAFRPRLDSPASGHGYNHTYNTNTGETVPLCKSMIRWLFCEDYGNLIFAHCMKLK